MKQIRIGAWTVSLLLLLSLFGCGGGGKTPAPEASQPAASSGPVETESIDVNLSVEIDDQARQYGVITGIDSSGKTIWSYTTEAYEMTELDRVRSAGIHGDLYVFVAGGDIIALNVADGTEAWRNSDFQGAGAQYDEGADGNLYFCGYYGPDFLAVSPEGETLARIEQFDPDYYWAAEIACEDGHVQVLMDGSPDGEPAVFTVDLADYSYTH